MVLLVGRGWKQYVGLLQGGLVCCRRFRVFVFCEGSFVVLSDGGSEWFGILIVARSLVRSVCSLAADDSVSPRTSSAH